MHACQWPKADAHADAHAFSHRSSLIEAIKKQRTFVYCAKIDIMSLEPVEPVKHSNVLSQEIQPWPKKQEPLAIENSHKSQ